MEDYTRQLSTQMKLIEDLIVKTEKAMKNNASPAGVSVHTTIHKCSYQYYFTYPGGKRKYAPKSEEKKIKMIVQKEYLEKAYKTLNKMHTGLMRFLKEFDINAITAVYDRMCPAKQMLITPILESDEAFIVKWLDSFPTAVNTFPINAGYTTDRGETVRSKSEKMIADLLQKHGIPYRYEPMLKLKNGVTYYPDFAALNIKKRKTIYWEHLGLISDSEYAVKSMQKLYNYSACGIMPGDGLIFSMEGNDAPFSIKTAEWMIKEYLL